MDKQVLYGWRRTYFATGELTKHFAPVVAAENVIYVTPDDLPALEYVKTWNLTETSQQYEVYWGPFLSEYYRAWFRAAESKDLAQKAVGWLSRLSGVSGLALFYGPAADRRRGYVFISTSEYPSEGISGADKRKVEAVSRKLIDFYDRIQGLPPDCNDELYAQYHNTGVYYKESETEINGYKLRYSVPISAQSNLDYNRLRTATEREHTQQEAERTDQHQEQAFQETFDTVRATDDALQEASADIEERYSTAIFYNRVLRYGALGLAVVVAVVVLVLTVRVMR